MRTSAIHVVASDALLRRALVAKLRAAQMEGVILPTEDGISQDAAPGDMLVAPVGDCPVERCAELVRHDVRVIVLTPIPRDSERALYLDAGACAYVPMTIDSSELLLAIEAVVADC